MGGFGSTRWAGHRRRRTVEEAFLGLSIGELCRKGLFGIPSGQGSLIWVRSTTAAVVPEPTKAAEMDWRLDWPTLTLTYRIRTGTEPDREFRQDLGLDATRLPSGGWRRWFLCPKCERRAVVLYLPRADGWFGCRSCHELPYWSQRLGRFNRLRNQAVKAWRRLGSDQEPHLHLSQLRPPKPKGMHWSTYERLLSRYEARRGEWEIAFVRSCSRLPGLRRG